MAITVNLYYSGKGGNARRFAEDMERNGIADRIRAEIGNLRYEYFIPLNDPETILLIDCWEDQTALDKHHASPMMEEIIKLRDRSTPTCRPAGSSMTTTRTAHAVKRSMRRIPQSGNGGIMR